MLDDASDLSVDFSRGQHIDDIGGMEGAQHLEEGLLELAYPIDGDVAQEVSVPQ